jgi:hypothetical protein
MSNLRWKSAAVIAVMAVSQVGCFTTRITTGRAPAGPETTERQWFMIGGLAPLSPAAGTECTNGLSWAESQIGVVDVLINVGLAAGGALIGSLACSNATDPVADAAARASCASTGASLLPFLLGTRTVKYTCAGGPESAAAPSWMPAPASQKVVASPEAASVTQPASAL